MKELAESVLNPIDVTVVITTFNDDAVLERAIESVLKSAPPVKLVIVDDGSTPPAFIDQRYEQNPRVVIVRQLVVKRGKSLKIQLAREVRSAATIAGQNGTLV